jgi:hypothetical protein
VLLVLACFGMCVCFAVQTDLGVEIQHRAPDIPLRSSIIDLRSDKDWQFISLVLQYKMGQQPAT